MIVILNYSIGDILKPNNTKLPNIRIVGIFKDGTEIIEYFIENVNGYNVFNISNDNPTKSLSVNFINENYKIN